MYPQGGYPYMNYGGYGYQGGGYHPGGPPQETGTGERQSPQQQPQSYLPGTPMPPPPAFAQQQNQNQQQPFLNDDFFPGQLPIEQSFIENILRLNRGKVGTFYMTYENNDKWNAKIFKGVIEAAGRDHIIISDPQTDKRYLLLMVSLDYVTFDEEIEYDYPFNNGQQQLSQYAPR